VVEAQNYWHEEAGRRSRSPAGVADRLAAVEFIHTCYRITGPERSIAFYQALGFEKPCELPIRDEAVNHFLGPPATAG
jgi:hypothetical protein